MAARTDDTHRQPREETGEPVEPADAAPGAAHPPDSARASARPDAPGEPLRRLFIHSSAPPPPPPEAPEAPQTREAPDVASGEDESALFEELCERHGAFVERLLQKRRDIGPESVKDIRQKVFETLVLQLRAHRTLVNARAMLVRIAGHEIANHGRARRRRPEADGGASADATPASQRDPEQRLHAADCAQIVHAVLARMTPPAAEVLRLVDLEGLSCAEVAEAQGRDERAVATQLCRARKRFAELALDLYGEALSDEV
jgi:RNA polymerase sigma factor (sigma-70 family)